MRASTGGIPAACSASRRLRSLRTSVAGLSRCDRRRAWSGHNARADTWRCHFTSGRARRPRSRAMRASMPPSASSVTTRDRAPIECRAPRSSAATAGASQSRATSSSQLRQHDQRDRAIARRAPRSSPAAVATPALAARARPARDIAGRARRARGWTCGAAACIAARAAARHPDAGDRRAARGFAPRVHGMLVQQHLHFGQPSPPRLPRGRRAAGAAGSASFGCERRRSSTGTCSRARDEPRVRPRRVKRESVGCEVSVEHVDRSPPLPRASRSSTRPASSTSSRPATNVTGSARST